MCHRHWSSHCRQFGVVFVTDVVFCFCCRLSCRCLYCCSGFPDVIAVFVVAIVIVAGTAAIFALVGVVAVLAQ